MTFLGYNGSLKDDAIDFLKKAWEDQEWVEDRLMQFISSQIERVNRGEIAAATIASRNILATDWDRFKKGGD